MICFTKLRDGTYGLKSNQELEIGTKVTVQKKNGGTSSAVPTNLIWTGPDKYNEGEEAFLYEIAQKDGNSSERPKSSPALTTCPHCGQRLDVAPASKEAQDDLPF